LPLEKRGGGLTRLGWQIRDCRKVSRVAITAAPGSCLYVLWLVMKRRGGRAANGRR